MEADLKSKFDQKSKSGEEPLQTIVKVDLELQVISLEGTDIFESFDIDPYKKTCLINGYDDIDYLVSKTKEIKAYEASNT